MSLTALKVITGKMQKIDDDIMKLDNRMKLEEMLEGLIDHDEDRIIPSVVTAFDRGNFNVTINGMPLLNFAHRHKFNEYFMNMIKEKVDVNHIYCRSKGTYIYNNDYFTVLGKAETMLSHACGSNMIDFAIELLDMGANPNIMLDMPTLSREDVPLLVYVGKYCKNSALIDKIIEKSNLNAIDFDTKESLVWYLCWYKQPDVAIKVMELGANIEVNFNPKLEEHRPLIYVSCLMGLISVVKYLMDKGEKLDEITEKHVYPDSEFGHLTSHFYEAVKSNSIELVKYLYETHYHKYGDNICFGWALRFAKNYEVFQYLVNKKPANYVFKDTEKSTIIHCVKVLRYNENKKRPDSDYLGLLGWE